MRHNMRRIGLLFVLMVAQVVMAAPPALAGPPHPGLDPRISDKGKNGKMYFFHYEGGAYVVGSGAWAKMRHNRSGPTFDYVLNTYGLQPGRSYALIYKESAWSDPYAYNFGSETADAKGNFTLKVSGAAKFDCDPTEGWLWVVPCGEYPWYPYDCNNSSRTIWSLVTLPEFPSGPKMSEYLIARAGIAFNQTDSDTVCPVTADP